MLHILGGSAAERGDCVRAATEIGHSAQIVDGLPGLLAIRPETGVVLLIEGDRSAKAAEVLAALGEAGLWLPVIAAAPQPRTERVVAAIRAGAIDYLALPLETGQLARALQRSEVEGRRLQALRRREAEARRRVAALSPRESQVIAHMSSGCANKEIARLLAISPRTVEIHRTNMMRKLRANHSSEAIRMWVDAERA